jgi:cell division protein FtsQ
MKLPSPSNRRSENIRRRRISHSHVGRQSVKSRKNRVVSSAPPPVMARTPMTGMSQPAVRSTKKGRRLYNVSLDSTHGAEMTLPALPRIVLSWRLISFLMVALLGFALYTFWETSAYRVDVPRIEGLKRLSVNQVNTELGLTGRLIFTIDPKVLEADLVKAFPEFSDAQVKIELPNIVSIEVTERTPVLVWVKDGESYLLDEQGVTFPTRGMIASGSYPTVEAAGDPPELIQPDIQGQDIQAVTISKITGVLIPQLSPVDQVKPLLSPEMVQSILLLSKQAPAGSKLLYDAVHGLGWIDRRGWQVYLGDAQFIEIKLQEYRAIMDRLKSDQIRPSIISVEYVHAPYYRLEQ